MTENPLARIDTRKIYPPLLVKYGAMIDRCSRDGSDFFATKDGGYRTYAEQDALYFKGRKTVGPGATPQKPLGFPVTWARGGQSWHQFGLAIDSVLDADRTKAGVQPSWDIEKYEPLGKHARGLGLVTGLDFGKGKREGPHVNLDCASKGITLALLDGVWQRTKSLDAVWAVVDARGPY